MNLRCAEGDTRMTLGEKLRRVSQRALGIAVTLLAVVITFASLVISAVVAPASLAPGSALIYSLLVFAPP